MAGPRPLEKCIALEPRGARRSGGPSTICPCLEHTTEYFLDPDIDCSLLTMAWRGYPHGGLRRRRANDTDPPPFLPRPGMGVAATRELALDGSGDTRPVARARLRPTGQALAVKPPLAWTLCQARARRGPMQRRTGTRTRAQRESDDNPKARS